MFPLCPAYFIIQIQECAHVTSVPSILYNDNIRLCPCTLSAQHFISFQYKNIEFARGGAHLPIAHALRLLSTKELRFGLTKLNLRKNNVLK